MVDRRQILAMALLPVGLLGGSLVRMVETVQSLAPNFAPRYGRGIFDYEWRDGTLWLGVWRDCQHWYWTKLGLYVE
jgi:hypothetical protein